MRTPLALLAMLETRPAGWAWFKAHVGDLLARMRDDEKMQMFGLPGRFFCDEEARADAAAALGERAKAVPGAPRQLDNSLDYIHVCAAGQKLNALEITKFLAKY
jgi:hypothetical protein